MIFDYITLVSFNIVISKYKNKITLNIVCNFFLVSDLLKTIPAE